MVILYQDKIKNKKKERGDLKKLPMVESMEKISFKLENTKTLNALNIIYELDDSYIALSNDDITVEFETNATIESIFKLMNSNKYGILEGGAYSESEMLSYFLTELKKDYTYKNIITINNNNNIDMYDFFEKYLTLFDKHTMIYNKDVSLKLKDNIFYYYCTGKYEISYNIKDGFTDFLTYGNYESLDTLEYLKIIELLSKLSKILL